MKSRYDGASLRTVLLPRTFCSATTSSTSCGSSYITPMAPGTPKRRTGEEPNVTAAALQAFQPVAPDGWASAAVAAAEAISGTETEWIVAVL